MADGESFAKLQDRIVEKAGLSRVEAQAVRDRKDGAGLVYEYDGSRWALEDGEWRWSEALLVHPYDMSGTHESQRTTSRFSLQDCLQALPARPLCT